MAPMVFPFCTYFGGCILIDNFAKTKGSHNKAAVHSTVLVETPKKPGGLVAINVPDTTMHIRTKHQIGRFPGIV